MSVVINTEVAGGGGGGTSADYTVREESGTSFTLTSLHANRRTDASNGSAITVTWNTGHGMTEGACGRIVQCGAGAVTLSAGTGTLDDSPNVTAPYTTTGVGSWIDWEYMGNNAGGTDKLIVTGVGVAAGASGASIGNPTFERFYDGTSNRSPLSTNNVKLARFVFTQAELQTAGGVSMVFGVNGGGTTDSMVSNIRWGAAGATYSGMVTMGALNASAAGTNSIIRVTAAVSLEDTTKLIAYYTSNTTEVANSVTDANILTLDLTALGSADVEFAVGCNVGATDRPFVNFGLAFFPVN